jgi:exopolyphosphatase
MQDLIMTSSLPKFLRLARDAVFKKPTGQPLTIVLGNTSADLDSFISAVVFAYCHTKKSSGTGSSSRIYVPLLNLIDVPSSDLWRLRPEYGTALRLAIHGPSDETSKETEKSLLQDLITIADIRADPASSLHATFTAGENSHEAPPKQDAILVDHNAPSVAGLSCTDLSSRLNLTGVIDHHLEEEIVSASANPRIIKTGIGSCTSLVVQYLRDASLWATPSPSPSCASASAAASPQSIESETEIQAQTNTSLALLALAPILIDTANLTTTGSQISAQDHSTAAFLVSQITPTYPSFDRKAFYTTIQTSKSNKFRLLSLPEILESDYKSWTETPSSSTQTQPLPIDIGIASLVADLPWLISHAGSASALSSAITTYAKSAEHDLSLLALITKGNAPDGTFRKELAVVAYGPSAIRALEVFEADAGELDLKPWEEDAEFLRVLGATATEQSGETTACKVWWQGDVSKTRKQVAPLLREAARKA